MAQIKISELETSTETTASGYVPVVVNGTTKKYKLSLRNNFAFGGNFWVGGVLTGSSANAYFHIPCAQAEAGTYTCRQLSWSPRFPYGGYCASKYGTNGASLFSHAGGGLIPIWSNYASVRTNEVDKISITAIPGCGFNVQITFKYALVKSTTDTTTLSNNIPIGLCVSLQIERN